MQSDYNRGDSYGANPQPGGYGSGPDYSQQYGGGQQYPPPGQPGGYPNQYYGQPPPQRPSPFLSRPSGIAGSPAQSTPAIPNLSEEDIAIFRETQKNIMTKRFLPAAVLGCGAIYMAHQRKFFKPSLWTYGIYLITASYATQFSAREELKRRVAESSSMSPFAQQVRLQLGYVDKGESSFSDPADFNYSQSYDKPSTGVQYSPYNRFHKQQQSRGSSEFSDDFASDGKDLTEFTSDPRSNQSRGSGEFVADDVVAGDTGFRTPRVVDQTEKAERSKLTYEELRMRNRAQYSSSPGNPPYNQPPMQPMNNDPSGMYNRPGSF